MIQARDAEEGTTYLHADSFYSIKIIQKHGDPSAGYVSSVLVESEKEPMRQISIAGGTDLIRYSETLHRAVTTRPIRKHTTQEDAMKKTAKKPTRASIIDRELLKYVGKDEVPFDAIASAVIAGKAATEGERKKVVAQSRTRSWWYKSKQKVNPASKTKK